MQQAHTYEALQDYHTMLTKNGEKRARSCGETDP